MRLSDLTDATADALRSAGAVLADLMTPTLRLGVTGLARSGKTVFITALVRSLVAGGRLPFFTAMAEGRIARAYLEPQPDDAVPRFAYEEHLSLLAADPPQWPESTRRISQLRITIEYEHTSALRRTLGPGRLHVDIVDYPGEWLIDLPLLDMGGQGEALAFGFVGVWTSEQIGWIALAALLLFAIVVPAIRKTRAEAFQET